MRYIYTAENRRGQIRKGTIDAPSKSEAVKKLEQKGLAVKKLQSDLGFFFDELIAKIGYVSVLEKVLFTKHMSVMIRAGLPIDESLRILREQAGTVTMRRVVKVLVSVVEGGETLSTGLVRFPRVFSELYVNVIAAGEKSGNLQESFDNLAVQLTKASELRSKIRSAMAYPTLVLVAAAIVGFSVATFVLPRILRLFKGFDIELPLLTRILITVAETFERFGFYIFVIFIAAIIFLVWFLRTPIARPVFHRFILRSPLVGKIARDSNLALFCRTLGTSLTSGLPIIQSVDVASKTFANVVYKKSLKGLTRELEQGRSLSASLSQIDLYPPIVYRMVAVGEKTGKLDEVLIFLAEFYENEVDITTKNLSTIIEPLLLIVIGIVVGGLAVAVIAPIYQITGAIAPGPGPRLRL